MTHGFFLTCPIEIPVAISTRVAAGAGASGDSRNDQLTLPAKALLSTDGCPPNVHGRREVVICGAPTGS